ncbi:hypothetical protein OY671_007665, partial [Metschnikowia pulcherrima]
MPYPGASSYAFDPITSSKAAGYNNSGYGTEGGDNTYNSRGKIKYTNGAFRATVTGDYSNTDTSQIANRVITTFPAVLAGTYNCAIAGNPTVTVGGATGPCDSFIGGPPSIAYTARRGGSNSSFDSPASFGVNTDANPDNNRSPYDNRFVTNNIDTSYANGNNFNKSKQGGAAVTSEYDSSDNATSKSITAYRHVSGDYARDGDHSPFTISHSADILKQHQFSQESQVSGNTADDKSKYVVGLYYFNENGNHINNSDFTPVTFRSGGKFATKSYAAFGQATWTPITSIDSTFGLRYTKDKKSFLPDQEISVDKTGGASIAASPNTPQTRVSPYVTAYRNEDAVTPSANVAFHVADNVSAYASFSKGFKSGGFVQRVFPPQANIPQFGAEKATAYEIGFKSKSFNRRSTSNGASFSTKYDESQVQVFTGIAPVTKNAASAEIKGSESEGR